MPQYQILFMDKEGTPPLMNGAAPFVFTDPTEANLNAKYYAKQLGEKLCVKPVIDEAWQTREKLRIKRGEYRPLPWHATAWWSAAYPIWKNHFPHAALEKPGYISYTKSPEDGARDKQSLLRPGAYLSKYFDRHLDVYGISQRKCVEEFMVMYGPIEIKFATTEEDIIKVYERGPSTCLVGKDWPRDIHPASIYAFGGLAVAYIGNLDGRVSARTLVWQNKKIYSRVYGDIARLTTGLQRLDYKWGAPIGAKLKRIQLQPAEYKNGRIPQGCFIAPYIDKKNQQGGGHLAVIDKGDHLEIVMDETPGSHHCGGADGYSGNYVPRLDEVPHYHCDRCEKDGRQVNNVFVVGPEGEDDEGAAEQWCNRCVQEYAWHCGWSGNDYSCDIPWETVSDHRWHPSFAEMYAVRCQGTGRLFHNRDVIRLHFPNGTAQTLSTGYVAKHYGRVFKSSLTSRYWPNAEAAYYHDSDGNVNQCAKTELTHHVFQCDGCDTHWTLMSRYQVEADNLLCPHCYRKFKQSKTLHLTDRARQRALPLIAAE